ncbi:hypothetical protein QBC42DRAFT_198046, partial [Cladorrhinum samala]
MSGWNEQRVEARKNRKMLARYSVPLLIASWDLANWLYDILENKYYEPTRCLAYGEGWSNDFTSFLFGQYFSGVHIIREMTQYFAHIRGGRAEELKRLLWKIQDEFTSMHYAGREDREMRWVEYHILAVQELMTVAEGEGKSRVLRPMGWVEFRKNYAIREPGAEKSDSMELQRIFKAYEDDFQRIVYRRFRYLYSTQWASSTNPQGFEKRKKELKGNEDALKRLIEENEQIERELREDADPGTLVVIPDHRVRRIQHLLVDLVQLLDQESGMKFDRPVRRCTMEVDKRALAHGASKGAGYSVLCDCSDPHCTTGGKGDFGHRDLPMSVATRPWKRRATFLYE